MICACMLIHCSCKKLVLVSGCISCPTCHQKWFVHNGSYIFITTWLALTQVSQLPACSRSESGFADLKHAHLCSNHMLYKSPAWKSAARMSATISISSLGLQRKPESFNVLCSHARAKSLWSPHIIERKMQQVASQRLKVLQRQLASAGVPRPRFPVIASLTEGERSPFVYGAAAAAVLGVCLVSSKLVLRGTCMRCCNLKTHPVSAHPPAGLYTRGRPLLATGSPSIADSIPYSYPAGPARTGGSRLAGAAFASIRPFTPPANKFQLFRITGDGSCMFRAVVQVGCTDAILQQLGMCGDHPVPAACSVLLQLSRQA